MANFTQTLKSHFYWQDLAWQGAFWKIISCACFAGINIIVHYLGSKASLGPEVKLPVNVILFFQNVFGFFLMIPILYKYKFKISPRPFQWKTVYPKMHLFRVATAVLGVIFMYLSLQKMSVAESVALSFTGPAFTIIGARLLLGEVIGSQRLLAIILSTFGVLIITCPDLVRLKPEISLGTSALFPLLSAAALAVSKLLTRQLAKAGETAEQLTLFLLLGMVPISFIPAFCEWVTPTDAHWPWLVFLGLLAVLAHITFGKAYALAEVTFLMPFGCSKFLFSMVLGYYFFLEIPSLSLWLGVSLIGLSLFFLAYKIPLYSFAKRFKSN